MMRWCAPWRLWSLPRLTWGFNWWRSTKWSTKGSRWFKWSKWTWSLWSLGHRMHRMHRMHRHGHWTWTTWSLGPRSLEWLGAMKIYKASGTQKKTQRCKKRHETNRTDMQQCTETLQLRTCNLRSVTVVPLPTSRFSLIKMLKWKGATNLPDAQLALRWAPIFQDMRDLRHFSTASKWSFFLRSCLWRSKGRFFCVFPDVFSSFFVLGLRARHLFRLWRSATATENL